MARESGARALQRPYLKYRDKLAEIRDFAAVLKTAIGHVQFRSLSYGDLWEEWRNHSEWPGMAVHLSRLRARYELPSGRFTSRRFARADGSASQRRTTARDVVPSRTAPVALVATPDRWLTLSVENASLTHGRSASAMYIMHGFVRWIVHEDGPTSD